MNAPPRHIGNYVLESERGRGAFGVVYRAHHRDRQDASVALKIVSNRGNLDRLMLEPALLSSVNHPCVVRLEDYFLDGDRLVLALEFIEGEDLKERLDDGETFTPEQVREFLIQMAGALAAAHAKNIIHRDIKLSNILVERSGGRTRYVLTDFGIGRQTEGIQTEKHTGGTYLFMAPEQLRGRPCPQSDLWALGVIAYRLLTGKMPFKGQNVQELSSQIFYATPPPLSRHGVRGVDSELETALFRLLEKSLNERTASAAELLRELGYRGNSKDVLPRSAAPRRSRRSMDSTVADRRLRRRTHGYLALVVVMALLYAFNKGLLTGSLLLGGMVLFHASQRRDWAAWQRLVAILVSFAALAASTPAQYSGQDVAPFQLATLRSLLPARGGWLLSLAGFLIGALQLLIFLSPLVGAYYYSRYRRLQRNRTVRQATLASATDPEKYLSNLRTFVDDRFEDVGFHLRYIEALLAHGRLKEVVVECRLLLLQDPYNFTGNLLLANAYLGLGLDAESAEVCDGYLAVTGYCFEFSELREQAHKHLARAS